MSNIEITIKLSVAALAAGSAIAMLWQRPKLTLHVVWAIFCASVAVSIVQQTTAASLGNYQHLVALGACATCNGYWLVAHALFRRTAFSGWHFALAGAVGLLQVLRELIRFAAGQQWFEPSALNGVAGGLGETLVLFSSTVLLLTIYEGLHGWSAADAVERRMRMLFVCVITSGIFLCTVVAGLAAGWPQLAELQGWLETGAAATVIIVTSGLIRWRTRLEQFNQSVPAAVELESAKPSRRRFDAEENALAATISQVVKEQQLYLRAELKVADVAKVIGVADYRVSRAICGPLAQKNFNRYINRFRIDHACALLLNPDYDHWPILTVGLESGFASIGPFNRAFKTQTGLTPSQFRDNPPIPAERLTA